MADEAQTTEAAAETATDAAIAAEAPTETPAEPAAEPAAEAPAVLTGAALIATLDKDGLELFARTEFGRELDKRKSLAKLREEVLALLDGSTQRNEAATAAADHRAANPGTPVRARHVSLINPATGELWEFDWNPLFKGNADLEPIYEG